MKILVTDTRYLKLWTELLQESDPGIDPRLTVELLDNKDREYYKEEHYPTSITIIFQKKLIY